MSECREPLTIKIENLEEIVAAIVEREMRKREQQSGSRLQ